MIRVKSATLCVLLLIPAGVTIAQVPGDSAAPVARSLVIGGAGLGALLPIGARGALTVTLGATGTVSSISGPLDVPPRSSYEVSLEAGYLHLGPSIERLRMFRYGRLAYLQRRFKPDPKEPIHSATAALGLGALAQVTARLGLMADVGLAWTVRQQKQELFLFPNGTTESVNTSTNWGIVSRLGVTLRAKPAGGSASSPSP